MTAYTVFPNAPITEALLDIRVQLPPEIDLDKLKTFHEPIKNRFPVKEERISFEAGFQISPKTEPIVLPSTKKPDGYFFRSHTENKVVQARLDGFTFNKLKPYTNWGTFSSEALELWKLYLEIAKPIKIIRIALRYINKIEIPIPMNEFKDYILTVPEIAPNIPQALAHFFMQLVIPNPEIGATAVISQTIEPITPNQRVPLIFDIDVFKDAVYVDNKDEIWLDFENLRKFKNDIFFNSTTDRAKELFK